MQDNLLFSNYWIYILAIISFVSPVITDSGVIDAINQSFIGKGMYNNNILLEIVF